MLFVYLMNKLTKYVIYLTFNEQDILNIPKYYIRIITKARQLD